MRNSRTLCMAATIASIVVLLSMVTTTECQGWDSYDNFDVTNDTGDEVNDLEATLGDVSVDDVSDYYTEDYEHVSESQEGSNVKIHWSTDGTTQPGEKEHFGFGLTGVTSHSGMDLQWTYNGQPVGGGSPPNNYPPDVSPGWEPRVDLDLVRSKIHNNCPSMNPVWIQRRVNTSTGTMSLDQLLVGGDLWNNATIIDATPISVPYCTTVTYDFDWDLNIPNYVMMYEVWENNGLSGGPGAAGDLEIVHLAAVSGIPEPGTVVMLVGLAGFVLFGYRRR